MSPRPRHYLRPRPKPRRRPSTASALQSHFAAATVRSRYGRPLMRSQVRAACSTEAADWFALSKARKRGRPG